MRRYHVTKENRNKVIKVITHDTNDFWQLLDVAQQLDELLNTANKFGCEVPGIISCDWDGRVEIIALPSEEKCCEWHF